MEEYTFLLTKLILFKYANKKIIFLDKRAEQFWKDEEAVLICDTIDNIWNVIDCKSHCLYINSARNNYYGALPDYMSHIYNGINVMYSLFWCVKQEHFGEANVVVLE